MTVYGFADRNVALRLRDMAGLDIKVRPIETVSQPIKGTNQNMVGTPKATIAAESSGILLIEDKVGETTRELEVYNPHLIAFDTTYRVEAKFYGGFDLPLILPFDVTDCETETGPSSIGGGTAPGP